MVVIQDLEGGVCGFSQTTPDFVKQHIQSLKSLGPEQVLKYRFVSVGMPTKLLVRKKGVLVEYQTLKQKEQYEFIYNKLNNYEFLSFNSAYVIFEQTYTANIHFHMIIKSIEPDHDVKAEFFDCFEIKKGKNVRHFIDVQDIKDPEGLLNYMFNKDVKSYEHIDQTIFKPLRAINQLQKAINEEKTLINIPLHKICNDCQITIQKEDSNSLSIEI